MRAFEQGVDVVEVNDRCHAVRQFAKRSKRRIYLERTSEYADDPRAIRVIGKSKGWLFEISKCIGFVPAEIAKKLMAAEMEDKVMARLQLISIHDKHSIGIRFDILGAEGDFDRYSSAR